MQRTPTGRDHAQPRAQARVRVAQQPRSVLVERGHGQAIHDHGARRVDGLAHAAAQWFQLAVDQATVRGDHEHTRDGVEINTPSESPRTSGTATRRRPLERGLMVLTTRGPGASSSAGIRAVRWRAVIGTRGRVLPPPTNGRTPQGRTGRAPQRAPRLTPPPAFGEAYLCNRGEQEALMGDIGLPGQDDVEPVTGRRRLVPMKVGDAVVYIEPFDEPAELDDEGELRPVGVN